ncbi:MAG: signal peptidase II [Lachnospiraceae bacterium]|nr:signal peptidase II [Sarcina sp.]MBQ6590250.1 signal peptidase II [Lachnospiraceae bacterium]
MTNTDAAKKAPGPGPGPAILLICLLVALDQVTKYLAVKYLGGGGSIPLIPGVLELTFVKNTGAAFGIFQNGRIFFFATTAAALAFITYALIKMPRSSHYRPLRICLYFIAAGAIGNLIDRILLAYVRDFIYFSLIDFPVFNVADIYITCSAFALIYLTLVYYKDENDFSFLTGKEG